MHSRPSQGRSGAWPRVVEASQGTFERRYWFERTTRYNRFDNHSAILSTPETAS